MGIGRPTKYNENIADLICKRIATLPYGPNKLCDMFDDMPCEDTIYEWRHVHNAFSENYAKAKMRQAEMMAERLYEISSCVPTYIDKDGVERVDAGRVSLQRLHVDTIKWQASKLAPKVYGDKVHTESTVTIRHEDGLKALD